MSGYITHIVSTKALHKQYTYLLNYYYILEDSIKDTYNSAVNYLYSKPKAITMEGDFEIIDPDEYEFDKDDKYWRGNLIKSIRDSVYIPYHNNTMEQLEDLGYYPLSNNKYFAEHIWNCLIIENNNKFAILNLLMYHWKLTKLNIHIISGSYDDESFNQYKMFCQNLDDNIEVTFHNTYLHQFDRKDYLDFIQKHEDDFRFWKTDGDNVHLTILDNPNFEIESTDIQEIIGNNKYFIVFQNELKSIINHIDYIVAPSNQISKLSEILDQNYPVLNDPELHAVICHPYYQDLISQMNYIRL
jgi:hypothetical protein